MAHSLLTFLVTMFVYTTGAWSKVGRVTRGDSDPTPTFIYEWNEMNEMNDNLLS